MALKLKYIELARRQRGWSQRELAEHPHVRIHQTFISQIERGTGLPDPSQRERLARVLGIPEERLLEDVPDDLLRVDLPTDPVAQGS
jgi:ribosome-binding protein aMBF1 (putative translation factor)